MGIDMARIDFIVLSHGHFDHGNGLSCLNSGKLICHPGCFIKRYRKIDFSYIGLRKSKQEIAEKFDLITSSSPYSITENILFLGGNS
jgi:7,8-dihydropterin-6-yl-methyl-4-(beta-D-ribofuranosyl)aminobenzene 5'-phosphate synthase